MAKEILIADSDKTEQEELRRVFEMTDYKLVFSENGEDALLRVRLFKPDLIIAQVGLREKSGLELCQAVKTDSEFKDIPFILLTGIFEEISEKDRVRAGADGVISKPLGEEKILSLVDQMFEEKREGKIRRETTKQEKGWNSLSEMDKPRLEGKEDFLLDGLDEENEEIIDLLEVVEEPESKMSIDDFITPVKAEPVRDIAPLESWDKPLGEGKKPVEKPPEEAFDFSIEEEKETGPRVDLRTESGTSPEEELFEKIELEEILEKVEQLKPSIEKEWPLDAEIDKRIEEALPGPELETTEKWMNLRDFESALKADVKGEEEAEPRVEEELQPLTMKEPKTESMEEGQKSVALGEFQPFSLEEPREQESLEPAESIEDEIQSFIRKELRKETPIDVAPEVTELSTLEIGTPPAIERAEPIELALEEETLSELPEEEFPEAIIEQLGEEEIGAFEEPAGPKEQEISIFREEKPPDFFQEMETQSFIQEVQPSSPGSEPEAASFIQGVQPSILSNEQEAPKTFLEEVRPQPRVLDRQMEEVIGKGVQEMMEGFITKVLPELTQSILNLTVERIEKMVKEIVPELAEKAIREEIRRIQKGDKD